MFAGALALILALSITACGAKTDNIDVYVDDEEEQDILADDITDADTEDAGSDEEEPVEEFSGTWV